MRPSSGLPYLAAGMASWSSTCAGGPPPRRPRRSRPSSSGCCNRWLWGAWIALLCPAAAVSALFCLFFGLSRTWASRTRHAYLLASVDLSCSLCSPYAQPGPQPLLRQHGYPHPSLPNPLPRRRRPLTGAHRSHPASLPWFKAPQLPGSLRRMQRGRHSEGALRRQRRPLLRVC